MRSAVAAFVLLLMLAVPAHAADTKPVPPKPAAPAPIVEAKPTAAKPSTATPSAATPPAAAVVVPDAFPLSGPYTYKSDGRRDPFQNLSGTGGDPKAPPRAPVAGIAGIRVDDLSVRGVMQSRDRLVAMIQGPDSRTYLIHQGDKLADGAVKSITPQGLVLLQDIVDPRAKDRTREVHKALRTSDDEKE